MLLEWILDRIHLGAATWADWAPLWAFKGGLFLAALLALLRLGQSWVPEACRRFLAVGMALLLTMPLTGLLLPCVELPLGHFLTPRQPQTGPAAAATLEPLQGTLVQHGFGASRNLMQRDEESARTAESFPQAGLPIASLTLHGGESAAARNWWPSALFLIWCAGLLLIGLRWAVANWKLRRILQDALPVRCGMTLRLAAEISRQAKLKRSPVLLSSDWVESPLTCSVLHPKVVLPQGCEQWSEQRTRMVLRHELQHVRSCDLLWQAVSLVACALHWFNPLAWIAHRCLYIEQERVCDRTVIRCGESPAAYADLLLQTARGLREIWPTPGAGFLKRFSLRDRLFEILGCSDNAPRLPSFRQRGAPAAAALLLGLTLAAVGSQPSTRESEASQTVSPGGKNPGARKVPSLVGAAPAPSFVSAAASTPTPILEQGTSVHSLVSPPHFQRPRPAAARALPPEEALPLSEQNLPPESMQPTAGFAPAEGRRMPGLLGAVLFDFRQRAADGSEAPTEAPDAHESEPTDSAAGESPATDSPPEPELESRPLRVRSIVIPSLGGHSTAASDVSQTGIVVGSSTLASGVIHPFLWTPETGTVDLGVPDGWLDAWSERVNDAGEVLVRGFRRLAAGGEEGSLFLWSLEEGYTLVGGLPGCLRVEKAELNAAGQVAGMCNLGHYKRTFFWSRASGVVDLGWLTPGSPLSVNTTLAGINNDGLIAGTSGAHAFTWTASQGLEALETQSLESAIGEPVLSSQALSLNAAGQVAGSVYSPSGSWPVLWDSDGQPILIGPLHSPLDPRYTRVFAQAVAVNEAGEVLGRSIAVRANEDGSSESLYAAFLWNPQEGLRELTELNQAAGRFGAVGRQFNERRQYAGWVEVAAGGVGRQAILWAPEAGPTILDVWEGDENSVAIAVNRRGQAVGWGSGYDYQQNRRTTPLQALLWEVIEEPPTEPPSRELDSGAGSNRSRKPDF